MAASYHRVVPHWGAPVREGLTNFQGEDIFQAETGTIQAGHADLGAELQPRYPGHLLCIRVSLATPSPRDHSQLVQVSARPPTAGKYQLHKADLVSFKELSPPREVRAAEVSKSCPRQEESPVLAAGCWLLTALPSADRQSSLSPLDR